VNAKVTPSFPLFLNLRGRTVAVVGAGKVGMRKAAAAVAAGADVRIVDPAPATDSLSLLHNSPRLVHIAEAYRASHLEGISLVFAAATTEVNACVVVDARQRGIWVNSATAPESGDFILPSVVRSGNLTIAASTAGAAPALSRRIREKLEGDFDASYGEWIEILGEMRTFVQAAIPIPSVRRELLEGFADWSWLDRLRRDGANNVRATMLEAIRTRMSTRPGMS
jgi:precorrin-2 dehydrogenase/sirohydrochlorin ferrochelatase